MTTVPTGGHRRVTVRHRSFVVTALDLEDLRLPVTAASLSIHRDAEAPRAVTRTRWDLQFHLEESIEVALERGHEYHVVMTTLDGRRFDGTGVLARAYAPDYHLDGAGTLTGLTEEDFA
jgi:hypothetical protein